MYRVYAYHLYDGEQYRRKDDDRRDVVNEAAEDKQKDVYQQQQ